MKCVFLDIETSGLDEDDSEVLEVAIMPWDDGKRGAVRVDKFRMLGNPEAPGAIEALGVNGYDYSKREELPVFQAGYLKAYFETIAAHDGYILGCNPSFDYDRFLRTAAKRWRVPLPPFPSGAPLRVRTIDVQSMAVPLLVSGEIKGLKLNDLGAIVGREQTKPHSAAADVTLTCDVFEALFTRYWVGLRPKTA